MWEEAEARREREDGRKEGVQLLSKGGRRVASAAFWREGRKEECRKACS